MREKHLFEFTGEKIAEAAKAQADYHAGRLDYWREEYEQAADTIRKTAKIDFREVAVTGGSRFEAVICYGDPGALARLDEACRKIMTHKQAHERFASDARIYATQGDRCYELETADVHYYRLGGGPLEE